MSSLQSIYGFNLDSDLVQKFLKDYTILAKKWQKTLFSVGSQVMWESSVMKKQMQLIDWLVAGAGTVLGATHAVHSW